MTTPIITYRNAGPGRVVITRQYGANTTDTPYTADQIAGIVERLRPDDFASSDHYAAVYQLWQAALAACTPEQ